MVEGREVILFLTNGEHISFCADVDDLMAQIEDNTFITVDHDDGIREFIATAHIVYVHVECGEDEDYDEF